MVLWQALTCNRQGIAATHTMMMWRSPLQNIISLRAGSPKIEQFWVLNIFFRILSVHLFPTCQVRVVRFYQSCSSPSPPPSPPPPLPPLPCSLPPCQLFAKFFANFRTQWALLDLNCKGLSALSTAGPQPGTFRAQWAPLDLNLGPSELSEHRWTSTSDPPSSVSTAGPQPGTLRAQWAPLDLNGQIDARRYAR